MAIATYIDPHRQFLVWLSRMCDGDDTPPRLVTPEYAWRDAQHRLLLRRPASAHGSLEALRRKRGEAYDG